MAAGDKERRRLGKLSQAYKDVLKTPAGKIVFTDQLDYCYFYSTTHVAGDSSASAFREGRRDALLRWMKFDKISLEEIDDLVNAGYVEE